MSNKFNFHIHTTHSDGGNTPAEVVAMLKDAGMTAFSITDHDTVEGNVEAAALAKEYGLTHINGIELSCCFADGELGLDESWVIHILGYGFDIALMRGKLAEIEENKHGLLRDLFDVLVADGYNIEIENVTKDGTIPERTYISKELIRKGYAANGNECFSKILNIDRYRPFAKYKPTIKEGIKTIQSCGGLAVWAHPFGVTRGGKKDLNQKQVSDLGDKIIDYGIDGIEVYYQQYTPEQIGWLNYNAETYKLYKTVGTDYHNPSIDLTKYPEYAETLKRERLAFDVVEPDAGVETTLRRIQYPGADIYYPNKNACNYGNYSFKCEKCGWTGLGSETVIVGDVINFDVIGCPVCHEKIEFISYPSDQDNLRFGTMKVRKEVAARLKEEAKRQAERNEKWRKYPDLKSPDQLPDIDADEIIITLREEGIGKTTATGDIWKDAFVVFYWREREIWRVPASFEYYTAYLRWGEILRQKYGKRLVDFETEYTVDLGGDSSRAFDKVREFRKSLSRKEG